MESLPTIKSRIDRCCAKCGQNETLELFARIDEYGRLSTFEIGTDPLTKNDTIKLTVYDNGPRPRVNSWNIPEVHHATILGTGLFVYRRVDDKERFLKTKVAARYD